ncbi:hypothetical protein D1871_11280 [Nakamurella silvestris]|nr:hypothetical protein D1871_11280 [Nakamurella silvestris]
MITTPAEYHAAIRAQLLADAPAREIVELAGHDHDDETGLRALAEDGTVWEARFPSWRHVEPANVLDWYRKNGVPVTPPPPANMRTNLLDSRPAGYDVYENAASTQDDPIFRVCDDKFVVYGGDYAGWRKHPGMILRLHLDESPVWKLVDL